MSSLLKISKNEILSALGIIIFLVIFRLIPHPSNFTPILAAGIFSGFLFRNFFLSSLIVLLSMFISDLYLGFHGTMIFTYVSLILSVSLGLQIKKNLKFLSILITGIASSVSFYIITNFGAWLTLPMYEKNLGGLIQAYILAIPFFHNTLLSTLLYLIVLKLVFDFSIKKTIQDTI